MHCNEIESGELRYQLQYYLGSYNDIQMVTCQMDILWIKIFVSALVHNLCALL